MPVWAPNFARSAFGAGYAIATLIVCPLSEDDAAVAFVVLALLALLIPSPITPTTTAATPNLRLPLMLTAPPNTSTVDLSVPQFRLQPAPPFGRRPRCPGTRPRSCRPLRARRYLLE